MSNANCNKKNHSVYIVCVT